jgi:hypothetical protein
MGSPQVLIEHLAVGRCGLTFSKMKKIEAEKLPATLIEELPILAERENQIGEVAEWSKALSQSAGID